MQFEHTDIADIQEAQRYHLSNKMIIVEESGLKKTQSTQNPRNHGCNKYVLATCNYKWMYPSAPVAMKLLW